MVTNVGPETIEELLSKDSVDDILDFWLGPEPYKYLGSLWWKGVRPIPKEKTSQNDKKLPKLTQKELASQTDAIILSKYGGLIREVGGNLFGQGDGWEVSSDSRTAMALVLLFDQFSRNAFRGTKEMFSYDPLAQKISREQLKLQEEKKIPLLPWCFTLFHSVSLLHSEDLPTAKLGETEFLQLVHRMQPKNSEDVHGGEDGILFSRIRAVYKAQKDHLVVLNKFKRYPHRNALLGRLTTKEEEKWLSSSKIPRWALSVHSPSSSAPPSSPSLKTPTPSRTWSSGRMRVLVLHGNRANISKFKKRTKSAFSDMFGEQTELYYAVGPHKFRSTDPETQESLDVTGGVHEPNKCWWVTTEGENMVYEGLEESIQLIEYTFKHFGPFDGIVGFSQGATLAATMASLMEKGETKYTKFCFLVLISGFYCRDSRPAFRHLHLSSLPKEGVHEEGKVDMRKNALTTPSFHIWGEADIQISPWRSRALTTVFQNPIVSPHLGPHFARAIALWPAAEVKKWVEKEGFTIMKENGGEGGKGFKGNGGEITPQAGIEEKWKWVMKEEEGRNNQKRGPVASLPPSLPILTPFLFHNPWLLSTPFWVRLEEMNPVWVTPLGVTRDFVFEGIEGWIKEYYIQLSSSSSSPSSPSPSSPSLSLSLLLDDIFLLSRSLHPSYASLSIRERKKQKKLRRGGEVFFWFFDALLSLFLGKVKKGEEEGEGGWRRSFQNGKEEVGREEWKGKFETEVAEMGRRGEEKGGGWDSLARLVLLVMSGSSVRDEGVKLNGLSSEEKEEKKKEEGKGGKGEEWKEEWLKGVVARLFAQQLFEDYVTVLSLTDKENKGEEKGVEQEGEEREEARKYENMVRVVLDTISAKFRFPSDECAACTPRKGIIHEKTQLDLVIGAELSELLKEYKGGKHRLGNKQRPKHNLEQVIKTIKDFLATYSGDTISKQKASAKQNIFQLSSEEYQRLKKSPISYSVLNPEPEPVNVSTAEQLFPLNSFLTTHSLSSLPPSSYTFLPPSSTMEKAHGREEGEGEGEGGIEGDLSFLRGTICSDKRLDLCKQVIGPGGIEPLMASLLIDASRGKGALVEHILLGNNIAGDGLGPAIASYILNNEAKITTWYIAGNRLTVKGIDPICTALKYDQNVRQLWLKRNPLRLPGIKSIATLLTTNTHLQVLDLTNTAVGNEGVTALFTALLKAGGNSGLKYLYLGGNGITAPEGTKVVKEYLKEGGKKEGGGKLVGLSLSCNRLGDEGVGDVVEGLVEGGYKSLERLDLGSVGCEGEGARRLGELVKGSGVRVLDLGFPMMTAPLFEVPNRIGDEGIFHLVGAIKEKKDQLWALDLTHNNIYQQGISALEEVICEEEGKGERGEERLGLVKLRVEQMGIPLNEISLERLRRKVKLNWRKFSGKEREVREECLYPTHLREIASVYRVNGRYKGDE